MNKESSNQYMKEPLDILTNIKRVEAPADLYNDLLDRIKDKKLSIIPLRRVWIAAASFVCLVSIEVYVMANQDQSKAGPDLEQLLPPTNNLLYHE